MNTPNASTVNVLALAALNGARNTPVAPPIEAPAIQPTRNIDPQTFLTEQFAELHRRLDAKDEQIDGLTSQLLGYQENLVGRAMEDALSSVTERDKARQEAKREAMRTASFSRVFNPRAVERDEELLACEIDILARSLTPSWRNYPIEEIAKRTAEEMVATGADGARGHKYSERQREHMTRSFRADSMSDGGALVPEQVSAEVVEYMRESLVPYRRGNKVTLTKGSMKFPKQNSVPLVYWIGEQIAPTATKMAFGSQNVTLKKLGALAVFSNEFLAQVEQGRGYFLNQLQRSAALEKQRAFYFGEGAEYRPLGIYQQTKDGNKFARTKAGAASTYAEIIYDLVKMQTLLLRDNGDGSGNFSLDNAAWLMNSMVRGGMLANVDGAGQFRFLAEMVATGSLLGVPIDLTETTPRTTVGTALTGGTASILGLIDYNAVTIADSGRTEIASSTDATVTDSSGTAINLFTQDSSALRMITDQAQILHYDSAASWLTDIDWLTIA